MDYYTAFMLWFRKDDYIKLIRKELRDDAELKYGLNL